VNSRGWASWPRAKAPSATGAELEGLNRAERILLGFITLLTIAAGVARYAHGAPDVLAFVLAGLALAGLAWVVSFATEQLGGRFGPPSRD
jgi:hypothetical protein